MTQVSMYIYRLINSNPTKVSTMITVCFKISDTFFTFLLHQIDNNATALVHPLYCLT
jgi:hypothetical protein